jgi:hypothetical protein
MDKIETSTSSLWIGEDDILRGVFKEGAKETLDEARENVAAAKRLAGDRKVLVLIDMSEIKMISREARALYAGPETSAYSLAQALITKSPISRMIGNFFIGLNKTSHPVRLFNSEDEALIWLKGQDRQ